jgi:hypothetical protein
MESIYQSWDWDRQVIKFQVIKDNQSILHNAEREASLWNDLKILLAR